MTSYVPVKREVYKNWKWPEQGVTIFLRRTNTISCPVASLLGYLALQGSGERPLFLFQDGQPLTHSHLVTAIRQVLHEAALQPGNYARHSFQIGAATTAAACGIPMEVIKTLRHWKSQAYQVYIRFQCSKLADISKRPAPANIWSRPIRWVINCSNVRR